MATLTAPMPTWRLWNMETGELLEADLPAEGEITEAFGPNWAELTSLGMLAPVQQWINDEQSTVSVNLVFFAQYAISDIFWKVDKLRGWASLDDTLDPPRVPTLLFDYGPAFQILCKLDKVGSLRWDAALRFPDASPRLARVAVTLRRWFPWIQYTESDPNAREQSTKFHQVKEGEAFEHIAAIRYGQENAKFGVLLRQDNPGNLEPAVGDVIEVPDLEKIQRRRLTPLAPIFRNTELANAARRQYFDLRARGSESRRVATLDPGYGGITYQVTVV